MSMVQDIRDCDSREKVSGCIEEQTDMFLILEYSTINVGEKRGRADDGCGVSWQQHARSVSTLCVAGWDV